ncbi:MAG: VCBS repeat-containing protein [Myxococcales bacterium]|nr:VCBS repeat-containing protein [Myxococcales bacterium]
MDSLELRKVSSVAALALVLGAASCSGDSGRGDGSESATTTATTQGTSGTTGDATGSTSGGGSGSTGTGTTSGGGETVGTTSGSTGATTSGGVECTDHRQCGDGKCIAGSCCAIEDACGDVACCGGGEVCLFDQCVVPGAPCKSANDCAEGEYCEPALGEGEGDTTGGDTTGGDMACTQSIPDAGYCLKLPEVCGPGQDPMKDGCVAACEYYPDAGKLNATLKWQWGLYAADEFSKFSDVWSTPTVGRIYDANCDGKVDDTDPPNVVFVSGNSNQTCCSCGNEPISTCRTGILRVLDGASGQEIWSLDKAKAGNYGFAGVSVALGDIDNDGDVEILLGNSLYDHNGALIVAVGGVSALSASVLADLDGDGDMEIAVAAHPDDNGYNVAVYDHLGELLPGWPQAYGGVEVRSIAVADVDGDGRGEILITKQADGPATNVFKLDGTTAPGWPQVGDCKAPAGDCIDYGGFNQNIGAGDLDGDGVMDVVSTYDAIGFGIWSGDGANFTTAPGFADAWVTGVDAYHDLALAMQGWGTGDRSEFTYSPPVIADIDGDGEHEVVLGGDHESSESTDNQGISVWVLNADMTRPAGWEWPKDSDPPLVYDGELGANIVPNYPAPAVGDLDGDPGLEIVIPAYDGKLRAYRSTGEVMWVYAYGQASPYVGASEALIVDLNGDGSPEILFATYSGGEPKAPGTPAHVIILDAGGNELHKVELAHRGSMAAPSIADLDGDGQPELVISLKDALGGGEGGVQIWELPGASTNCMLWATGRGTPTRTGYVP